jgi:hypothetical protein
MGQEGIFNQVFEENNRFKYLRSLFAIFFISPVFALFISLKNGVNLYSRWMMYLMFFVLGYSLDTDPRTGSDVIRIEEAFLHICDIRDMPNMTLLDKITVDESKELEIGFGIIAYISSFFTNNSHVFIGFLGFIYGVFYVQVFLFFLNLIIKQNQFYWSIILSFAFIHSPYQFQAFRFYSGAIIFVWLFIKIFMEGNKNFILNYVLLIAICFIHNAHFVLAGLVFFRRLIPNRLLKFFWLVYLSFFIISHTIGIDMGVFSEFLPNSFKERADTYSNEGKEEIIKGPELSWFLVYAYAINDWFFFIMNNINFYLLVKMKEEKELPEYVGFFALLISFSSLLLGTEGYRLHVIANHIMFVIFFTVHNNEYSMNILKRIESKLRYAILFYVFILFRRTTDFISLYVFILNPLLFYAIENNFTIAKLYAEVFK